MNHVHMYSVVTVLKILQAVGFGRILEEIPRFRIRFLDENIINLCNVYRRAIQYSYIKRPKRHKSTPLADSTSNAMN